jgi:hypothetical protein
MVRDRGAAARGVAAAALALALLGPAGCGKGKPKTYPVKGKVEFVDGKIEALAESNVEFQLEGESKVRAYGKIEPDGRFVMQTFHEGKSLPGAPEGTYRARILLPTDEEESEDDAPRRPTPVHPRFLQFETSNLTFKVPVDGDITVTVSLR